MQHLRKWNSNKRIYWSSLDDVFKALKDELIGSGQQLGYKFIWQRLKFKQKLRVKHKTVLRIVCLVDGEGVAVRKAKCFHRRQYYCPEPNFVWHLDGFDKLKPFGFAIHGWIDGYSRHLMWLEVADTNNDPSFIAEYYLECVETLDYASQRIRCDLGTENSTLKHLHPFLVNNLLASVFLANLLVTCELKHSGVY